MKTTLDLPEELLARLRQRAAQDGRALDQVAAGLLTTALGTSTPISRDLVPKRLPLIKLRPAELAVTPRTGQEFADFVKDIDQQHEVERYERTFGHQYVDRALP